MPIRDKVYDKLKSIGLTDSKEDFFKYYDNDENVRKQAYNKLRDAGLTDSEEDFYEYMKPQKAMAQQSEDDAVFEANAERFRNGQPTEKVTTQSMIDAHPELGLQPKPARTNTSSWEQPTYDWRPDQQKQMDELRNSTTATPVQDQYGNEYYPVKPREVAYDEGVRSLDDISERKARTQSQLKTIHDDVNKALGELQGRVQVSEMDKLRPANLQSMPVNPVNQELMPEYTALRKAQRLVEESNNIIEEASKKGNTNFMAGLARGFWDNLNAEDYTFGADDAAQSAYLYQALDKAERGEKLTKAEETLLDAAAINMAVQAYYAQDLGRGYGAGSVTAESIPFMMEMAINPISGFGKASAKKLLGYGVKKFLGRTLKGLGKGAAAGMGMAATTGAGDVLEGATDRLAQNYRYTLDAEGNLSVEKKRDMGMGEALTRSFATRAIENQSEMIFNAFKGMGGFMKGVQDVMPGGVNKFFDLLRNNKAADAYRWLKNSKVFRNYLTKDLRNATQIGGLGEEYLEEVYNNLANFAIGEMEWKDVVSLDNNIDTMLGLVPTQVMFGLLGMGGAGAMRYQTRKTLEDLQATMNEQQRRDLEGLLDLGLDAKEVDVRGFIRGVMQNENYTIENKRDLIKAAYYVAKQKGIDELTEADTIDKVNAENAVIDSMTDPSTGVYSEIVAKLPDGQGGQKEVSGCVVGWIGEGDKRQPVFVPEGMENTYENRRVLKPSEWVKESLQEMPAEQVKAVSEEMIREEDAQQAEMEAKYAPEVINAQMQQGVPFNTPSSQIVPVAPMPEGNGWIVEEYALDTNNKVAKTPIVREMTNDEYRDMLQSQIDAQEAVNAPVNNVASGENVGEQVNAGVNAPVNNPNVQPVAEGVATEQQAAQPQAPVIPTKKDGSIDFVTYGKDNTFKTLGERYGEKMPNKVAVTAKALADDLKKAQKKLEKAEEAYDNAPIGREQKAEDARDKAKAELEAIQKEADFWAEMDAEIKNAKSNREALLNPQADVDASTEPMTTDEFIAQQLAVGNIVLSKDDYMAQTGYGAEEVKAMNGGAQKLITDSGMTLDAAGERLMEMDRENGTNFFNQDDATAGRDALIELLGSVRTRKELNQYIAENRKAQAKKESEAIRNASEEYVMSGGYESLEDYLDQMEAAEMENPFLEDRADEIMAIFAEEAAKYEQSINNTENGQGTENENAERSDSVLPEEQSDDSGRAEEQPESERIGDGTSEESESTHAATEVELKQEEGETTLQFAERAAEENRRRPLRKRAEEWSKALGVKVTYLESIDDVDADTRREIEAAHAKGKSVPGWVNKKGEVFFFMPDLSDLKDVDDTYIHEVVAHVGLPQLLGKERFGELCDKVWEMMPQSAKDYYMSYPGVKNHRDAADEYIAHLAEQQNLTPAEKTIWDSIVKMFREMLDKALNGIISKSKLTDEDISNLIKASYANLKSGVEGGSANAETNRMRAVERLEENVGEVDAEKGDVRFAVRDVLKGEERAQAIKDLMAVTGRSKRTVEKWLKAEESLASVILNEDNVGILDMEADESVPSIWKNSDYPQGTVEFSNICKKRLPFTTIYQRLQKEFPDTLFDAQTLNTIRNTMKEMGEDVACALCFVEDRRQLLGEIGQGFIDAVKGMDVELNDNQKVALDKLRESGDKYVPNLFDIITLDGMKELRKKHPAVAQAFIEYNNARGMQSGRLFQAYSAYNREILKYNKKKVESINNNGGLRIFSFSDFEAHHLIDLVQVLTDCAAKGIKVQGYTKVPEFAKAVKDTNAKINRSLIPKGVGYVDSDYIPKEGEAVSPNVINGKRLLFDTIEGIDVNNPNFFDSTGSKSVGNILVAINDEHARLAMADPFVDYIIGFHTGQSKAILKGKGIDTWVNYKNEQLDKEIVTDEKGNQKMKNAPHHGLNIYTDVLNVAESEGNPIKTAKQFTERFIDECNKRGWIPRFHRFLNRAKDGRFLYTPGYHKFLIDFKLFDKNGKILPQEAVVPVFDNEFNKQILDEYVKGVKEEMPNDAVYEAVKEAVGLGEDTRFKVVYHGSSADFDKFDRNFSGSGEGQAVMGAGHYVTTSEGTGRYYAEVASNMRRKVVQEGGYTYNGKVVRSRTLVDAYEALKKNEFDVDKAIESIEHRIAVIRRVKGDKANTTNAEEAIRLLNEEKANKGTLGYQEEILEKPARHLYEVEIPDDNGKNYFDLDKKASKKTKDEAKRRLYSALENSEEAEYWKKNRDIIEDEWRYNVNTSEATNDSVRATMEQFLTQEEVADILSDMGYVGSKSKATDGTTYIIYKDDSLEIKSNTRFRVSNQNQEIFVSNAQKAVESIKQEKGTPQQWLAMIEKNGGLKAGEDKWLGLSDWLKGLDKKSVTKAEILEFIGEHKIQIEEVHYSGSGMYDEWYQEDVFDAVSKAVAESKGVEFRDVFMSAFEIEYDDYVERVNVDIADDELAAKLYLQENENDIEFDEDGYLERNSVSKVRSWGDTVVSESMKPNEGDKAINATRLNYTTEGLENKAEIALVVPTIESWNQDDEIHFGDAGEGRAVAWIRFGETTVPQSDLEKAAKEADDALTAYQNELAEKYLGDEGSGDPTEYLDMMSEEEGKHMRELSAKMFDTREAANANQARVLVIDEIQSKRHQEGREKGYRNIDAEKELEVFKGKLKEKYPEGYSAPSMTWEQHQQIQRIYPNTAWLADEERGEYEELQKKAGVKEGIPEAPFEKNWSELAMKRMLRYAAENGFDKVAWTTGMQQAERYDLGTVAEEVRSGISVDGERVTDIYFRDGSSLNMYHDENGNIERTGGIRTDLVGEAKNISEVIGKEIASKILTQSERGSKGIVKYTGIDLSVGGEGMKAFYDKMLPSFVNKYVKKWETKVQDIELPLVEKEGRIMHSVDVTDAMKESVMEGQTMFRISDYGKKVKAEVDKVSSKYNSKDVMFFDNEMTDEEVSAVIPGYTAADIKPYFDEGILGGYSSGMDKISIFANNNPVSDIEDTLFHENLHSLLKGRRSIVEAFAENALERFPKNVKKLQDSNYEEKDIPEELLVRLTAKAMVYGIFDDVAYNLPEGEFENLKELLKEFGYEYEQEIKSRALAEGRRGTPTLLEGEEIHETRRDGQDASGRQGEVGKGRKRKEQLGKLLDQVADMGLEGVLGNKAYSSMMVDIYKAMPEDVRAEIADDAIRHYGGSVAPAVNDFIGPKSDGSFMDKVVAIVREALRKIGIGLDLNANEVRYMAWRSKKPLDRNSLMEVAEDIDMRFRLKVGEYDGSPTPDGGGTRFRTKKPEKIDIADNRSTIIKRYDEALKTGMFNFQEAFQDRMLSLKVLMDEIVDATGKKVRSFEDAYEAENQLSSINKVDQERYIKKFYTPLVEYLKEISKKHGEEIVRRYIYCKSGLERNEVLRQRDADEAFNAAKEELDEKLAKNQLTQAQYDALLQQAEDERLKTLSEDVDYSGIRGMLFNVRAQELFEQYQSGVLTEAQYKQKIEDLKNDKANVVKDWKDFAEQSVADLESRATSSELDELWSRINAATNETLRIDFESGMIDRETYEAEKKMMKYYVPLRDWENTKAEEMYEYRHDMTPAVTTNQQRAKGRESEAANPMATIALMAQNAIVRGNRNKMKMKLYSFVVNRPTDLASVRNVWYVRIPGTKTWEARYADTSAAQSEAEIKQIMEQFESDMELLEEQGDAFRGKLKQGMGYRASRKQKDEHIVVVMINGKEYGVYINGNPRAAQAVNGLTNAENVDDGYAWIDNLKRLYGGGLTSWNPDFIIPNFVRDTIHASTMTFLDRGVLGSVQYMANIPKIFAQVSAEVSGLSTGNAKLHQYFEEFVNNGGETGYTEVHTLEDYKKEYQKLMNEAKGLKAGIKKGVKLPFEKIAKVLEAANRIAEDVNRFNAYVTSREAGENIVNSISAAKNITVNFNRKGALHANSSVYGKVASFMNRWILFFNPSVQGLYQLVSKSKMNPKRATALGATIIASGFFMPLLNEMLVAAFGGDDEDDYWNQSDFKRRNNWMLFTGDGYVSIPLPPVLREIYGMGDIIYGVMTGHIPPQRAIYDVMNQVQSAIGFVTLLPEVSQEPDVQTWLKGFAPDLASPFLDIMSNTNFMGRPIAKWTDYNETDPEYERVYKGVGKHWVALSKVLNELGGNETRRSDWWGNMINPAMMEHLVTSYTGGIGKTINNLIGMTIDAIEGDRENMDVFRKAPIVPRFYTPNDEKTVYPGINRKFYEFEYQYNNAKKSLKKSQDGVNSGEHPEWQKYIDEMDKNGEKKFIEYFKKEQKKLKKLQDKLKEDPNNKELEKKVYDKKAEISAESFKILSGQK